MILISFASFELFSAYNLLVYVIPRRFLIANRKKILILTSKPLLMFYDYSMFFCERRKRLRVHAVPPNSPFKFYE